MKVLAFCFGGLAVCILIYVGSIRWANRLGQEFGKSAVTGGIEAMQTTPEQKAQQQAELHRLEDQVERLRNEAEDGVRPDVKFISDP